MTDAERAEWTGNPCTAAVFGYSEPVNLFPIGTAIYPYGEGAVVKFKRDAVIVEAAEDDTRLEGYMLIGESAYFEEKTLTWSLDSIYLSNGGEASVELVWMNADGTHGNNFAFLIEPGTMTFVVPENTDGYPYLGAILATNNSSATTGTFVRFDKIMLEFGDTPHDFVPYTPILPTPATKGAYNYSDLNRVEMVVAEFAEKLGVELDTKTDWKLWDIPNTVDMERFLGNIRWLRSRYTFSPTTPDAPESMDSLNYTVANNIERILCDLQIPKAEPFYCGDIFCGEV